MATTPRSHFCVRVMFRLERRAIPNWSEVGGATITLAGNLVELVIGELAPLRFEITLEWFPIAFEPVPAHFRVLAFMTQRRVALTTCSLPRSQKARAFEYRLLSANTRKFRLGRSVQNVLGVGASDA